MFYFQGVVSTGKAVSEIAALCQIAYPEFRSRPEKVHFLSSHTFGRNQRPPRLVRPSSERKNPERVAAVREQLQKNALEKIDSLLRVMLAHDPDERADAQRALDDPFFKLMRPMWLRDMQ